MTRDENDNYEQQYDKDMVKSEIKPLLQKKHEKEVDEMIKQELSIMKLMAAQKPKKAKKAKKPKKAKAKKHTLKLQK